MKLLALLGLASTIAAIPVQQTLTPDTYSLYHSNNQQIEYDVQYGQVLRVQNENSDISTLVTFSFPEATRGRKCELKFERDDVRQTPPPAVIDAFFSSQFPTKSGTSSNYRDVELGRLIVPTSGTATVDWGNFVFDCPAGQKKGFEFTPTGDRGSLFWAKANDGPYIRYF